MPAVKIGYLLLRFPRNQDDPHDDKKCPDNDQKRRLFSENRNGDRCADQRAHGLERAAARSTDLCHAGIGEKANAQLKNSHKREE